MKNIFQQNYQKIREQYKSIIDALQKTGNELEIKFILIGAQSRNVDSSHLEINKRETKDIDYLVQLKEFSDWQKLSDCLISEFGAEQDPEKPYRFILDDQIFDIIPFGGFAQNREVVLGDNSMKLSVVGLKEVSEKGTEVIENDYLLTQIINVLARELHGSQYDAVDQEYRNGKQDSLEDITKYRLLAELRRTIDTNY